MQPPHILVVEEILPEVRRRVARSLYAEKMSQSRIAEILGTSQAMVSRYLKQNSSPPKELLPILEQVSRELIVAAAAGDGPEEITDRFCKVVDRCISEGMLDERYRTRFGREPCRSCMGTATAGNVRNEMLEDLNTAVEFLKSRSIKDLIPALKVNIAYGIQGAKSEQEVASFPGRLPDKNGRILEPMPPEFGASKHLASVLLSAMKSDRNIRAVISLAFNERIKASFEGSDLILQVMDRSDADILELLERKGSGDSGFTVDPGDFGIEPCLYIFGSSPLDVVSVAVDIQKRIGDTDED
jgi:predicted fused transcriptional regulator/phosphomethylpyrimidine kinase/predicted transcriptional regulator